MQEDASGNDKTPAKGGVRQDEGVETGPGEPPTAFTPLTDWRTHTTLNLSRNLFASG